MEIVVNIKIPSSSLRENIRCTRNCKQNRFALHICLTARHSATLILWKNILKYLKW